MQNYTPFSFAAWMAVIYAIVATLVVWFGLNISETGTTNLMIAWGIVSICYAIEWHARNTK